MITGRFATLAAFDVDNSEIAQLLDVFTAHECPESNMKADSLVGCWVRPKDTPEQWGSLWSSIAEPRDLCDPFFEVLYTEEYKDILAGHPRTVLGIYIVIWCLVKGHLETFWPEECHGCPAFRKSHQAEEEATDDSNLPHEAPFDSPIATENLVITNLEALEEEIGRLIILANVYGERYNIPMAEPEDEQTGEEPTAPTEFERILEDAMNIASEELNLPPEIKEGLLRSMLDAAYFLIQVWGQMVLQNGTLAHFTCHNLGLIMTRHREAQSMVVSKFLEYTDAPLLHAAALTVYAYHDAAERYDEHKAQNKPFSEDDSFFRETSESVETEKKWREQDQDLDLNLDNVHLAFKATKRHLWSNGFSHLRRTYVSSSQPAPATISRAGILLDDMLGQSAIDVVWSGKMIPEDGGEDEHSIPIAVKVVVPERENNDYESDKENDEGDLVRHEALIYEFLASSGKQRITPRYYGVFQDTIGTVALVLENSGKALKSFDSLTDEQAQKLFAQVVEMQTAGVIHGDLAPRHIVRDSEGELRIIDFHTAELGHRCSGKKKCRELQRFWKMLGF
ncbi:hypothetical protein DFH06DRAFT_1161137 [Mycena polygramma]|nr:hypothetical protein DFH06DRAFT_1161137 [Mycena polygramma]